MKYNCTSQKRSHLCLTERSLGPSFKPSHLPLSEPASRFIVLIPVFNNSAPGYVAEEKLVLKSPTQPYCRVRPDDAH